MRECLRDLYARHHRFVWRICWHYVQNRADADDLAHEVLLKAAHARADFRHDCSEATWLHRIAANHCRGLFRLQRDRWLALGSLKGQTGDWPWAAPGQAGSYGFEGPQVAAENGIAGRDESRVVAGRVLEALRSVDNGALRHFAYLCFDLGLPQRGIARATGLPRPAVRRRMNRMTRLAGDLFRSYAREGPPLGE